MSVAPHYFQGVPDYEPGLPAAPKPARKASKKAKPPGSKVSTKGAAKAGSTRRARTKSGFKMGPVKYHPMTARATKQLSPTGKLTKGAAVPVKKFYETIKKLPIYLISGHSCICPDSGDCLGRAMSAGPAAKAGTTPATFAIPRDTYLLSIAQAGDLCHIRGPDPERLLYNQRNNFRDYLILHSQAELDPVADVGVSAFSLYAGILRGKGAGPGEPPVYWPNQNFAFEEKDAVGVPLPDDVNGCGVYRLDTIKQNPISSDPLDPLDLKQSRSLIKQSVIAAGDGNAFTSDIIEEIYRTTGIRKGIFILYGCLSKCVGKLAAPSSAAKSVLDKAARIMYEAEGAYKGPYGPPLITRGEHIASKFKSIPLAKNKGLQLPPVSFAGEELAEMVKLGAIAEENAESIGSAYANNETMKNFTAIMAKTKGKSVKKSKKKP